MASGGREKCMHFPVTISHCCDIAKAKDRLCTQHRLAASRWCVRNMSTASEEMNLRYAERRILKDVTRVRNKLEVFTEKAGNEGRNQERDEKRDNVEKARDILRAVSLSSLKSILENRL